MLLSRTTSAEGSSIALRSSARARCAQVLAQLLWSCRVVGSGLFSIFRCCSGSNARDSSVSFDDFHGIFEALLTRFFAFVYDVWALQKSGSSAVRVPKLWKGNTRVEAGVEECLNQFWPWSLTVRKTNSCTEGMLNR